MSNKIEFPREVPIDQLVHLRRNALHRHPELSGEEEQTSDRIIDFLQFYEPDEVIDDIGGYGVAAVYNGKEKGPTVMFRCELDALPILETTKLRYKSQNKGVSHKCGHDGHMAILCGLSALINRERPKKGRVILLFQPAEEIGLGAKKVIADNKFDALKPDWIFALHNIPGYPLKQIVLKSGRFNPAVNSIIVKLKGCTAHAGEPENGRSPALAMAQLLIEMMSWNELDEKAGTFTTVTPVYQQMGEKAYGVSAGYGEVHLTLRCDTSDKMKDLEKKTEKLAHQIADKHQLELDTEWLEEFYSSHNDEEATACIRDVAQTLDFDIKEKKHPFKWGEDFGMFTHHFRGAMFCLGAGEDQPALHHPDYDFPDEIIETGVKMFYGIAERILNV